MARPKAGEVNKSQAVREYISKHKRAKVGTVVEALAAEGIEVSPSLVAGIRHKNKTRRGSLATRRGPGASSGNAQVSLESLLAAKKLVSQAGGVEAAQEALRVLGKLAL